MSRLQELVREANAGDDADDADTSPADDDESGDTQDAEDTPADDEQSSEARIEAIGRKLDSEAQRHAKAVARIMGDDMGDLVPCPLCVTPGFVLVQPPPGFDPDQRRAVMLAMGEGLEPEYRPSSVTEACPDCDGLGLVLTGSRAPQFTTKACDSCGGQGWRTRVSAQAWQPPTPTGTFPGSQVAYMTPPSGTPDAWGRPAGHPHYGLDPSQVGAA